MMHTQGKAVLAAPVILSGGSGTRLWPLSRAGFPKQFLCLDGSDSLFQQTARRLASLAGAGIELEPLIVVSNDQHRFIVQEQLRELDVHTDRIILEPAGRNTAPALTLAALQASSDGKDPVLVVVPSDHAIKDVPAFVNALAQAVHEADRGSLVVLGVQPTGPETGYGYIEVDGVRVQTLCHVARFVEKPTADVAAAYVASGVHFWNAGIFVLKASLWLALIGQFRQDVAEGARASWALRQSDGFFVRPQSSTFVEIASISVDYAIMERSNEIERPVCMVPLNAGWSDLGTWGSLWDFLPKDPDANALQGQVIAQDVRNSLIYANHRLVAAVGVEGVVIVETPDAVLVLNRSQSQVVKSVVEKLGSLNRQEQLLHRKVHRPWGWYDGIDEGDRFKVKRIQVKPGASLSLQKHFHRAEHWVVVKGTAEITVGDKVLVLTENQSTYIPLGTQHRLSNPGKIPLEIIEVQSGSYLGEDDIVRFKDEYGRDI